MAQKITNKLAALPQDISIDRYEEHHNTIELFVSYPAEERICPYCGSHDCVIHSSGHMENIRHTGLSKQHMLLTFHVPRLRCKSCRMTFHHRPYFVQPGFKLSQVSYQLIYIELMTNKSIRQIAYDTGTTDSIVCHVMMSVEFNTHARLPETLCIDEFKGSSGEWDPDRKNWNVNRFHCNIVDGDSGCVVDILPQIDKDYLSKYFHSFSIDKRNRVKYFCCDMHGGFISLAKSCFPNALICTDNFHTVRLLTSNIDDVRRSLQRESSALISETENPRKKKMYEEQYKLLKSSQRLLKMSEIKNPLTARRREKLNALFLISHELEEAYMAYQEFLMILCYDQYVLQRAELTEWIDKYKKSTYEGTRKCANTIQYNRKYIQNAWKYGKSNASCEGINNRIKVLKRNGYGAHSFEYFRQRILFHCGPVQLIKGTYSIASQKKPSHKEVKQHD